MKKQKQKNSTIINSDLIKDKLNYLKYYRKVHQLVEDKHLNEILCIARDYYINNDQYKITEDVYYNDISRKIKTVIKYLKKENFDYVEIATNSFSQITKKKIQAKLHQINTNIIRSWVKHTKEYESILEKFLKIYNKHIDEINEHKFDKEYLKTIFPPEIMKEHDHIEKSFNEYDILSGFISQFPGFTSLFFEFLPKIIKNLGNVQIEYVFYKGESTIPVPEFCEDNNIDLISLYYYYSYVPNFRLSFLSAFEIANSKDNKKDIRPLAQYASSESHSWKDVTLLLSPNGSQVVYVVDRKLHPLPKITKKLLALLETVHFKMYRAESKILSNQERSNLCRLNIILKSLFKLKDNPIKWHKDKREFEFFYKFEDDPEKYRYKKVL